LELSLTTLHLAHVDLGLQVVRINLSNKLLVGCQLLLGVDHPQFLPRFAAFVCRTANVHNASLRRVQSDFARWGCDHGCDRLSLRDWPVVQGTLDRHLLVLLVLLVLVQWQDSFGCDYDGTQVLW